MKHNRKVKKISPHIYGQLIFDKGALIYNVETIVSSINGAGKTGYPLAKE